MDRSRPARAGAWGLVCVGVTVAVSGPVWSAGSTPGTPRVVRSETLVRVLAVPRLTHPVTVDAQLGEWELAKPPIVIDRQTTAARGRLSLGPNQRSTYRAAGTCAWDDTYLYLAMRVHDRAAVGAKPGHAWKASTQADESLDELRLLFLVPGWLRRSSRAIPPLPASPKGWYDSRYRLCYYVAGARARPLPGRSRYVCRPATDGYTIEAAIELRTLGFVPRAGDRVSFALLAIDVSTAGKGTRDHFLWNAVPTAPGPDWWSPAFPGSLYDSWGELRLLGRDGWGADVLPAGLGSAPGGTVRYLATVDVAARPIELKTLEIVQTDTDKVGARVPAGARLAPGQRHTLTGAFVLPRLQPGRYDLRLATH